MPLSRFLTRLIGFSVLPLLALAAWMAVNSVRAAYAKQEETAANLTRNFAAAIDQQLDAGLGALNMLALSPLIDDPAHWEQLYAEAQSYRETFGNHVVFADAGEPMRMLFNTRERFGAPLPPLPRPLGNSAARLAAATGRPAVGDTFFGPIAKEPLVAMAVPTMRDGRAAYLMLVTFETGHFQRRLDRVALPADWSLSLLDGRGEAIARRTPAWMAPDRKEDAARSFKVKSSVSSWIVVLEIPNAAYRAPLFAAAGALTTGILVATFFGVLGGTLAGRRLGRAVAGLAGAPAPGAPPPEIREIASVRRQLDEAEALRGSNQILEQRVGERTSELAEARDRIATFAAEQERAIEGERRRLSREVHDQIGQVFTAIKLIVGSLEPASVAPDQRAALVQALEQGIGATRRITAELRPPLLDDLGFGPAVEHYLRHLPQAGHLAWTVDIRDQAKLGEGQTLGAFRIIQEAVTNALKHCGNADVKISGQQGDGGDSTFYVLTVADDGCGFVPGAIRPGAIGLAGMRERAALLGGACTVASKPGCGTVVELRFPVAGTPNEHPPR